MFQYLDRWGCRDLVTQPFPTGWVSEALENLQRLSGALETRQDFIDSVERFAFPFEADRVRKLDILRLLRAITWAKQVQRDGCCRSERHE